MASFIYKKNNKLLTHGGFSTRSGSKTYIDFPINVKDFPLLHTRIYSRERFVFDDAEFSGNEISILATEISKLYSLIKTNMDYDEITRYELQRLGLALSQLVDFDSVATVVFYAD
jgi:hypothetical protein